MSEYSEESENVFRTLDEKVLSVYADVQSWSGWKTITDPDDDGTKLRNLAREVFLAVYWYQRHTTEAGFHMIGRLPKKEVKLLQQLCSHKAEEAEHALWALEDYLKLGGSQIIAEKSPSPATFAVAGVWWRMAMVEDPFGYIGAEYLFEKLTEIVTKAVVEEIKKKNVETSGLRFIVEHATEDERHAKFLEHIIKRTVTEYPDSTTSMYRCFDYFNAVYPIPVWDEALTRAQRRPN